MVTVVMGNHGTWSFLPRLLDVTASLTPRLPGGTPNAHSSIERFLGSLLPVPWHCDYLLGQLWILFGYCDSSLTLSLAGSVEMKAV